MADGRIAVIGYGIRYWAPTIIRPKCIWVRTQGWRLSPCWSGGPTAPTNKCWLIKKYMGKCEDESVWIRKISMIFPNTAIRNRPKRSKKEKALMQSLAEGPLQEEGASQGLASNMV